MCSGRTCYIKIEDSSYSSRKSATVSIWRATSSQTSSLRAIALQRKLPIWVFLCELSAYIFKMTKVMKC